MGQAAVKLSQEMIDEAGKYALTYARSIPMQIEHWARIGKLAEENADLPYSFIEDALKSKAEIDNGNVSPFEFRQD
ncbi:MAG: ParD-like family protein [Treponema sp.]|jgi:hypothetical protein|nr:ParD-like family protein [Treponema sp.]